jgi:hypothetical protein
MGASVLADFELDPATGVRHAPGTGVPAGYLDGAERHLLERLPDIRDRGTGSDELATLIRDWPTLYHLTPYRATIFDCLGFSRAGDARVLELGAGCGAITRWLGEHCGAVEAIEGDAGRAAVTRLRCEDQDNVRVYTGNYSELGERDAFDVVTLIGVLEYGHLYHPAHPGDPEGAALANLALARDALTQEGVLVLAIENRLGLKYLNGAREDHSGRLFEGIQGYPDPSSPVTFSARELRALLAEAGFAGAELLLPFPDYKLARTIVNPERCEERHRIHNWVDTPAPDRGAERGPLLFNETLATREVARAGLLGDLANSFLLVAFAGERGAAGHRLGLELGWAARHYSLDRRAGLRKRVTLTGDAVEHEPVDPPEARARAAAAVGAGFGLTHVPGREPFRSGDLVLLGVLETLAREGLGDAFAGQVRDYRTWLLEHYGDGDGSVRADGLDVTWWNLVDTGARWETIDGEWRMEGSLPVDFVVWRTLHHFALRNAPQLPQQGIDAHAFAGAWLRAGGGEVTDDALARFAALDTALQHAIAFSRPLDAAAPELEAVRATPEVARGFSVVALADEVSADPDLLAAYASRFGAADDATLVLYAPGGEEAAVVPALERAMTAAGLTDGGPDLLLVAPPAGPDAEAEVAGDALALLSRREPAGPLAALPRFGPEDVGALRALAETHWAIGLG